MQKIGDAICLAALIAVALSTGSANGQQATPSSPTNNPTPQQLAKSVHNPFEDFVKVQLQFTTGFGMGPRHDAGQALNLQPLIPVRLNAQWDLIARPSFSVVHSPIPHERFGTQDLQASFFLTPHRAETWLWGIGPIFQAPTASATELGTGRWSAGPTAALVYSNGPWFSGVLAYHLMSFAGDRDRGSVNQTYIEPEISYSFESGWYLDWDPPITFDWTASARNGWTLPMGADAGKAFNLGSQSMSLELGAYDLVKQPSGAPQWFIRVQMMLLFPTGT